MDIRQLEYFQTVANLRSITKAAQQLYVSQPTITIAIQKLEQELEIPLFDRNQKQFVLTNEGQLFLERISDVLTRLQNAVSEINEHKNLQKGYLRIGIPPMIGSCMFPEIIAGFTDTYPSLTLDIFEDGSLNVRQSLKQEDLDIGIINLMNISDDFFTIPLSRQEFLVCLHHKHPLANNKHIDIRQLQNENFILFNETTCNRKMVMQECLANDFIPKVILSTNQIATMKSLVAKNLGICFLTKSVTENTPGIVTVPLKNKLFLEFGLTWKKERTLSSAAKAFIQFIKSNNEMLMFDK